MKLEIEPTLKYFKEAAEIARRATCYRAHCGAVIVSTEGEIIGRGFNAPPLNDEKQRKCDFDCRQDVKPKYDKTCCVHAEWNAIIEALKDNSDNIAGSTLYFMRIDDRDMFTDAGKPFCTVCSRLALQSGIAKFALWNDNKPDFFDTAEYNLETYDFYL